MQSTRLLRGLAAACVVGLAGCDLLGSNELPVVEVLTPAHRASFTVGDVVDIEVSATDPDGSVERVTVYVNDDRLGDDFEPPYQYRWHTAGEQRLQPVITAEAWDDDGNRTEASITVEVAWAYQQPEATADGWETASLQDVGISSGSLEDFVNDVRDHDAHRIHGVLILRHGKLVFEKYFDGLSHPTWGEQPVAFGRETLHVLSSVAKSYTTTLLGIAIEQGFIESVDARVMDYFPELAQLDEGLRSEITLRHLATMSAGLEWDESTFPLTDERNDLTAWLRQSLGGYPNPARLVLQRDMVAEPGTLFRYSGGATNVLGEVIHRATGMMADDFATEYLFEPLGIGASWWWRLQDDFVYVSGDVAQRPRDMLKLGQMYLQGGTWDGTRMLPLEWVEWSATPYHDLSEDSWARNSGHSGYSLGWWPLVSDYGPGAFTASGWGGQWIAILPEHDMIVALTAGAYWESALYSPHQILRRVLSSIEDGG